MGEWIPKWLAEFYSNLLVSFGSSLFTVEQAKGIGIKKPQVTLPRLARTGWIRIVHRGKYVASEPIISMISCFKGDWRESIEQKEYVPLLEFLVSRFLNGYGKRLKGLLLFGSVARGTAKPESDIDLIVVAEGMSERYGDRVREAIPMLYSLEVMKRELYFKMGLYPNIDLILIDENEFGTPSPFYLDVVKEGIILFDRENVTANTLNKLRVEFEKIGVVRVERADGRWSWLIPKSRRV